MTPDQALATAVATRLKVEGDKVVLKHTQDVDHILEANKAHQNAQPETGRYKGDFTQVGSIPVNVFHKWIKEDGVNPFAMNQQEQHKYLMRKLNDPEYRYLTTMPGRL